VEKGKREVWCVVRQNWLDASGTPRLGRVSAEVVNTVAYDRERILSSFEVALRSLEVEEVVELDGRLTFCRGNQLGEIIRKKKTFLLPLSESQNL
jgi:hypothetical protein